MRRRRVFQCVVILAFALGAMGFDRNAQPLQHRYVSLARGKVNMRQGPSFDHKIEWVYHREGLPMLVTAQYDVWRRVEDSQGTVGWIESSMLSSARTVVVTGKKDAPLRDNPRTDSHISAYMQPGVIARVQACKPQFCEVVTAGAVGWMNKNYLWGVDKGETF
jgi:SH3-like domain-containing protein